MTESLRKDFEQYDDDDKREVIRQLRERDAKGEIDAGHYFWHDEHSDPIGPCCMLGHMAYIVTEDETNGGLNWTDDEMCLNFGLELSELNAMVRFNDQERPELAIQELERAWGLRHRFTRPMGVPVIGGE